MAKVCMLVAYHPFLDARVFKKEAMSLVNNGHDVTIIAPRKDGYLFDIDGTPFKDRFLERTFVHEKIKIVTYDGYTGRATVPEMIQNLKSGEYSSFLDPLTQEGLKQDADIFHAQEYLSLYSGVGIKRAMKAKGKSVKLIYDSHEIVPDPFGAMAENRKKDLHEILEMMLKEVDYIIAVSDSMKAWYLTLDPSLPVGVIYNSPPLATDYKPKQFSTDKLVVGYEGNITSSRGSIDKIIGITRECSQEVDFKFKIIGGMRHNEKNIIPSDVKDKIELAGWVDYYKIPEEMKEIEVGWIDYEVQNALNHAFALPNKFFSFLNNGVPVIVNKCPEMERFIQTYHCGMVIDKENATVQDYKKALLYLHKKKHKLKSMSINARKIMEEIYSWEHMEKRLLNIYERLLATGARYIL
ncbi:glycosyltransferase [Anoxybacteroides tepidamans]|uniref:glycosyltransferase n=1 Tax=Anoxybacteroides tepidamans TaxID=265948 RepID=UPI000484EDA4|nr:glycosyltransferase [Anoxybacillus tepidamans]